MHDLPRRNAGRPRRAHPVVRRIHALTVQLALRSGDVRWSRRQRWKNDVFYIWIKALFSILPFVSPRTLRRLGRLVGAVAYRVLPRARSVAKANLALAFPDLDDGGRARLCRESYATLGAFLGDALATVSGRAAPVLPFADERSRAIVHDAMNEGRGVVLVSAHLGPWETVAASLVAHGVPLVTLARAPYDPRLGFVYERLREGAGVRAIDRGAPGATARIVRTLRSGGVLGAPMDLAARVPSVVVPFLGHPASTPVGPARLAIRSRAALVVVTAARKGDDSLVLLSERVFYKDHANAVAVTERLNEILSARIRAYPTGWVWMHERFAAATRPPTLADGAPPDAHSARYQPDGRPPPDGARDP